MKVKEGVILDGLQPVMRHVLRNADRIWKRFDKECVITGGVKIAEDKGSKDEHGNLLLDLIHSAGSLHYYGLAVDLRTRYFNDEGREAARLLTNALMYDKRFQVVRHSTHIHVEWDDSVA